MRVEKIVQGLCQPGTGIIHKVRLAAVAAIVVGIVKVGRLSLTAVGRRLEGPAKPKHSIKRVDRALSNRWLHAQRHVFYRMLAARLVASDSRPTVLVDWTKVSDRMHALTAAVPIGGRALPIYSEVHPESVLGEAKVQRRFLKHLAEVLPPGCRPIIVADAGFHGAFFNVIVKLGWDFLGRLRGHVTLSPVDRGAPTTNTALWKTAQLAALDAGTYFVANTRDQYVARVVTQRHKSTGRDWRHRPRMRSNANAVRSAYEPWILVTSLSNESAARVANIYTLRMQIEETFRDEKNPRFGWALRHVRTSSVDRMATLLMLAAFAILAATIVGWVAENSGLHRSYQANTVKRRVLSLFVLGTAVIARNAEPDTPSGFSRALMFFRLQATQVAA
jgi:hypothetical protein